ncbi:MAG: hypothetical protein II999_03905 [Bacteroidaceae bacterium]|nr:hypothetical protein [Bacteroidaceae bacterium]
MMADNYLEKQYEQYQARKVAWEKSKQRKPQVKRTTKYEVPYLEVEAINTLIGIAQEKQLADLRRTQLYTPESLYEGYRIGEPESYANCYDNRVYQYYLKKGKDCKDVRETLARTLHDHAITHTMHEMLATYDERRIVGIMGGHGLLRTDKAYRQIVHISKRLTEMEFLLISGGGPGAMEATHLGAWMAGRTKEELDEALKILEKAPSFKEREWLDTAFQVRERFPQEHYISLGVPTWLYGHEPATPFATHIAKYFENALREDGLLTIAKGGLIYSPGSAGTLQEIFQEAVQNHYLSFGYASPMIFLGEKYWTQEMPVFCLLEHLVKKGKYKNLLLTLTNDEDCIVDTLERFSNTHA